MSALGLGCVKTRSGPEEVEWHFPCRIASSPTFRQLVAQAAQEQSDSTNKISCRVFTQPGSKADISASITDVRFTPESGHSQRRRKCPLSAKSGHSEK